MVAPLITSGMLSQFQRLGISTMTDTAQILRNTQVSDGRGGYTDTWSQAGADTPCRLVPIKAGDERVANGIFLTDGYWKITLPSGTSVTAVDRIRITTKNNRTFEVKGVDGPKSDETMLRAYCVEAMQ